MSPSATPTPSKVCVSVSVCVCIYMYVYTAHGLERLSCATPCRVSFSYPNTYILLYVSSYCYICVLILLYMCPHPTIYMSSYHYICIPHFCIHILLCVPTEKTKGSGECSEFMGAPQTVANKTKRSAAAKQGKYMCPPTKLLASSLEPPPQTVA